MAEHHAMEEFDEAADRIVARGRRVWRKDQFTVLFVLILATVLSTAFLGDGTFAATLTLLLMAATTLIALRTSSAGPRVQLAAASLCLLAIMLIAAVAHSGYPGPARIGYGLTMMVLASVTPYVIARRIASHLTINIETISGAADIYLLIGLFFALAFSVVGAFINKDGQSAAQAFLVASRPVHPGDLVYFSYTTLSTVGYGDLTASTALGRMLAITEALLGQLYLVTVVALLVANIGRTRQQKAGESAESSDTTD